MQELFLEPYEEVPGDGPLSWQDRALCLQTDPEAFFPEKGGSTRDPKKVCLNCEVRSECLGYALENGERFGVWGGLSERERQRLKPPKPVKHRTAKKAGNIAVEAENNTADDEDMAQEA